MVNIKKYFSESLEEIIKKFLSSLERSDEKREIKSMLRVLHKMYKPMLWNHSVSCGTMDTAYKLIIQLEKDLRNDTKEDK